MYPDTHRSEQIQVQPTSHHFICIDLAVDDVISGWAKWLLFSKASQKKSFKVIMLTDKNVLLYWLLVNYF